MNDGEQKELLERLRRYEDARRVHLSAAISLVFGLAAAAVGFCVTQIVSKESRFSSPGSYWFLTATGVFALAVLVCILTVWIRLKDLRLTAEKLRLQIRGEESERTRALARQTSSLGKWTWRLFNGQLILFGTGVVLLTFALWLLYRGRLLP